MKERARKIVDLGKEIISSDSIESLKVIIQRYEEMGATEFYIGAEWDRCGDYDGCYIEFYKYRPETDEEYNERTQREETAEKKRLEEETRKLNEKNMKELETYLKLKEKFEK